MPDTPPPDTVRPMVDVAEPDAHGQAALLLAESLLHALVATATLTNADAIEVLSTAVAVKREVATEAGESKARMNQSLDLLARMRASFVSDQRGVAAASRPRLA